MLLKERRAKRRAKRQARAELWNGGTATPLDHLLELRSRLLKSLCAVGLTAIGGWLLSDWLLAQLTGPLRHTPGAVLNFATLGAGFDLRLRVSCLFALVASSPVWMWQLWAFVGPGLRTRERRFVVGFTLAGTTCFSAGVAFAWWLAPRIVQILNSLNPADSTSLLNAQNYLNFLLWLLLAFGLAACFPLAILAANFLGVLSARAIFRGWRWAVVACYAFGAIANPLPDAWSMLLIGSALMLSYLLVGLVALLRERLISRRAKSVCQPTI